MAQPTAPTRAPHPALVVLALAAVAGLISLARLAPPDGHERMALAQFFGRFHPLLLHLPIGLLTLVPILELAGERRRDAAAFTLGLATVTALAATFDGWLLGWSGGYSGARVTQHLWGGVILCLLCVAASLVRARSRGLTYGALLIAALAAMVWTSHQGGNLTHGESFLTQFAPAPLRSALGLPPVVAKKTPRAAATPTVVANAPAKSATPAAPTTPAATSAAPAASVTIYNDRVGPLLEQRCITCHKEEKHKGGLRMDSFAELMKGGDSGAAVVPGDTKASELFRRITLDPEDDEFMPGDGKPPLTPDEVKLIEQWIVEGAKER